VAVLTIVLAVVAVASAFGKLTKHPKVVHSVHEVCGVPLDRLPALAALEIAGGVGAVVGLWVAWIGMAASIGLVLYFVGAVVAHLRVRDTQGIVAPLVLAALWALVLVLRAA
jgi:hypothetical protein